MISGFFSLLMAVIFSLLDAPDVAFAEAAVGAGITTMLLIATVSHTEIIERGKKKSFLFPIIVTLGTAGLLIYGTFDFSYIGDKSSPSYLHIATYYINFSELHTGVPNMVTAILASYRGYDTLGELVVIFTAGIGVLALLYNNNKQNISLIKRSTYNDLESPIIRISTKIIIPILLLFALYVQFHGEYGPGGGFQAGVLFAAAFVLYALVYGTLKTRLIISQKSLYLLMSLGLIIYIFTGLGSFFLGANFLDYGVFSDDFKSGQIVGIFLVELGVGITVSATMISIFLAFREWKTDE